MATEEDLMDEKDQWKKIEEIWVRHDKAQTGILERDEGFNFLRDMLREYKGCEPSEEDV